MAVGRAQRVPGVEVDERDIDERVVDETRVLAGVGDDDGFAALDRVPAERQLERHRGRHHVGVRAVVQPVAVHERDDSELDAERLLSDLVRGDAGRVRRRCARARRCAGVPLQSQTLSSCATLAAALRRAARSRGARSSAMPIGEAAIDGRGRLGRTRSVDGKVEEVDARARPRCVPVDGVETAAVTIGESSDRPGAGSGTTRSAGSRRASGRRFGPQAGLETIEQAAELLLPGDDGGEAQRVVEADHEHEPVDIREVAVADPRRARIARSSPRRR